ncbi:MAG: IS701 family transposase [Solirubrobacteraceae bacterium]
MRRGCWTTRSSRRTGRTPPESSASTRGRWARPGTGQIGVSVHAVGGKGTVPLGWALYLPQEWCEDAKRRKKAKIPEQIEFRTKPELAVELVERAAGWRIDKAPILGDCAYGKDTALRERLDDAGREYVLSVSEAVSVFAPETIFEVLAPRQAGSGWQKTRPRPDCEPERIGDLISRLGPEFKTVTFRDGPNGKRMRSRFCFLRVRAAHEWEKRSTPPREEWLIVEWPRGKDQPTDYWLSNLPVDTKPERLARLARLRWKIELDDKRTSASSPAADGRCACSSDSPPEHAR